MHIKEHAFCIASIGGLQGALSENARRAVANKNSMIEKG
jgi:hypothetical protein